MADNITLKTYKGGNVTPQDDAIIYETAIPGSGMPRPIPIAILRNPAVEADGSAGTMACAVSQAQEAPAMWTVLHHSRIMGNIIQQRPRRG